MIRPDDGIIDEIAVARAAAGEQLSLTKAERQAAFEYLLKRGYGPTEIARRMQCCTRTVERHRAVWRQEPGWDAQDRYGFVGVHRAVSARIALAC